MQILFIRHGESEADLLNVHEGRADFPLTELGRKQVHLMAKRVLRDFPPEWIYASPLKRARETGEILAEIVQCPIEFYDELMEFNNGVQAGMDFETANKLPELHYLHDRFENGESFIEFRMRIEIFFSKLMASCKHHRIAIVAHGGVINNLLRSFLEMPINKSVYFKNGDTAISLVEMTEKGKIIYFLNDTSHLR